MESCYGYINCAAYRKNIFSVITQSFQNPMGISEGNWKKLVYAHVKHLFMYCTWEGVEVTECMGQI